jgi:ubiquinone/menaquinone biosynthesis C-methylase UbiE
LVAAPFLDRSRLMVEFLQRSWGSFSSTFAGDYLKASGPSQRSRQLLGEVLCDHASARGLSVLDLGCGNGQLYELLRETKSVARYVGVDFSAPLLAAARQAFAGDTRAEFVEDDVSLLAVVKGPFDFVIYSHVIEMLASPETSLRRAKDVADKILIRFFEPPEFDAVTVELREMTVGENKTVPYIRWKMSQDYYRLILANIGCKRVDIYQADGDKDQVHVLHFS